MMDLIRFDFNLKILKINFWKIFEPFFKSESWEELLAALDGTPGLVTELAQLRNFVAAASVQKAQNLSLILRDEFPHERSLDDPAKLSDALQMVIFVN